MSRNSAPQRAPSHRRTRANSGDVTSSSASRASNASIADAGSAACHRNSPDDVSEGAGTGSAATRFSRCRVDGRAEAVSSSWIASRKTRASVADSGWTGVANGPNRSIHAPHAGASGSSSVSDGVPRYRSVRMKSRHGRPAPARNLSVIRVTVRRNRFDWYRREPIKPVPILGAQMTETEQKAPPGWLVLLLAVSCGLTVANLYYAQPLLVELRQAFGVGEAAAGGVVTATQIGYAAGMLLLVPLGDRLENRGLVATLLAVACAGLVATGIAPGFAVLLIASLAVGAASVVVQILIPFAADLAPDAIRGRIVGRVVSGLLFGILLSRVVASLLAEVTSWRVVFLISAGAMAALAVVLRFILPRRAPKTDVRYGELLRSTFAMARKHPALRHRALYQSAMFGAFSAFWTTIAFVLTAPPFNYSQLGVGLFALAGAAGAAVAPLAGRWSDHGHGRRLTAAAFVLCAAAFALAGLGAHSVILLAIAAIAVDTAVQTTLVVGQHTIYQLDPSARARINSVYLGTFFIGGAIGSQAGSIAYHLGGWTAVVVFAGVLPLLGLAGMTRTRT